MPSARRFRLRLQRRQPDCPRPPRHGKLTPQRGGIRMQRMMLAMAMLLIPALAAAQPRRPAPEPPPPAAAPTAPAAPARRPLPASSLTHQTIVIPGGNIAFTAAVEAMTLNGANAQPQAEAVTTAFLR